MLRRAARFRGLVAAIKRGEIISYLTKLRDNVGADLLTILLRFQQIGCG